SPRLAAADAQHARMLAENIENLPAVIVHEPSMTIIDGAHRVHAARMAGRSEIGVRLFRGSMEDAFVEAVRQNVLHGKPLTLREREQATLRLLDDHPDWSDRRIAEVCGLSPRTIASIRARSTGETPQLSERVGRDG